MKGHLNEFLAAAADDDRVLSGVAFRYTPYYEHEDDRQAADITVTFDATPTSSRFKNIQDKAI